MKTARLFQNGQSQAVRLPKEFRFNGNKVFIKKMGEAVILIPYQNSWQSLFASLPKFSNSFMEGSREQPEQPTREIIFE